MLFLLKATILLLSLSVFVIVNGQGQLNFQFSDIIVITQEGVNTSTCHISYNNINDNGSYFIAYSEFDEIDEQTFEDRTFASHIITYNNTDVSSDSDVSLYLANFSIKVPKFDPYTREKIGNLDAAHLPLYRSNKSNGNEEYNTYNPSIAVGTISSFVVFDSYHPETKEMYIEFNNLKLSQFESVDKSSDYGYPVVANHLQSNPYDGDHYLLVYIINSSNIRVKTVSMLNNGDGLNHVFIDDGSIWDENDVTINNTRILQWKDTESWIIGYDVTVNGSTENEIYGNAYWWPILDDYIFENEPVLLSQESCPPNHIGECHKILQDIVPVELMCQDQQYDASYLVIYTADKEIVMDLVKFDRNDTTKKVTLDRVWQDSYYVLENPDDDTSNILVGDIQDSNLIKLYHINDPTDDPSDQNTDYYIMSYVDEDNRGLLRSFGISGCNSMDPQLNWLGVPQEFPSTLELNPWPAAVGSYIDTSFCMSRPQYNPESMMLAWYEYGDIDIVIDGKECKNCDGKLKSDNNIYCSNSLAI